MGYNNIKILYLGKFSKEFDSVKKITNKYNKKTTIEK
jgi:hypothetical protein